LAALDCGALHSRTYIRYDERGAADSDWEVADLTFESWVGDLEEMTRALNAPDMRERLTNLGAQPMSMTPAEFDRFVRSEMDDAARIVKAAGISAQ